MEIVKKSKKPAHSRALYVILTKLVRNKINDGTFSSTIKNGNGVFSAILIKNGINVVEVH